MGGIEIGDYTIVALGVGIISGNHDIHDNENRRTLNLLTRPLLIMEASLFDKKYMSLKLQTAKAEIEEVMDKCKTYFGNFSFLWHNSSFRTKRDKEFFREVLLLVKQKLM